MEDLIKESDEDDEEDEDDYECNQDQQ